MGDASMTFYAHSENAVGDWHALAEHLVCVAKISEKYLSGWHCAEEGGLAGMLHDLGKYGDLFQARLRGEVSGLDHWSQGAWLSLAEYQSVSAAFWLRGDM